MTLPFLQDFVVLAMFLVGHIEHDKDREKKLAPMLWFDWYPKVMPKVWMSWPMSQMNGVDKEGRGCKFMDKESDLISFINRKCSALFLYENLLSSIIIHYLLAVHLLLIVSSILRFAFA